MHLNLKQKMRSGSELRIHECPRLDSTFWVVREEICCTTRQRWWTAKNTLAEKKLKSGYMKDIYYCPKCGAELNDE